MHRANLKLELLLHAVSGAAALMHVAIQAALKAKLIAARKTSPLFDTASFTRSLEAAYAAMTERPRDGQPPAAIRIAP